MVNSYSRHLFVKTNQSCNLNCKYCYEREKNNSIFDEEYTYLKIIDVLREKTQLGTKIKLIGGEPFIAFKQIKNFCQKIWSTPLEEKVHFQITTNGTLVHGEIQEWLSTHRNEIDCKLSLDGNKISQDINRPNSFEKIDITFFANTWRNCTINMVVTPETLPFFADNVIFLHNSGFTNIVPIFAVLTNWDHHDLKSVYYNQLIQLAEFYLCHPEISRCRTLNLHLDRLVNKYDCILCDIGKKIIFDVNSEKYYPCHLFFPSVCGENHPPHMDSIDFSFRSNFEKEPCKSCKFINICHTCYAANFIERGALGNRDMSICDYRKIDFLVNAKLEYWRITNTKNPSSADFLIMKAISETQQELEIIEKKYLV